MRVLSVLMLLLSPALAFAGNQAACQNKCAKMIDVCQQQCTDRFPKGKQAQCKSACKGSQGKCEERCENKKQ